MRSAQKCFATGNKTFAPPGHGVLDRFLSTSSTYTQITTGELSFRLRAQLAIPHSTSIIIIAGHSATIHRANETAGALELPKPSTRP